MSLGMLIGYMSQKKDQGIPSRLIDFLFLLGVAGSIYCLIVSKDVHLDIYYVLFSCLIIIACLYENSLVNKLNKSKYIIILGDISFDMLLLHFPINVLWKHLVGSHLMPSLSVILCLIFNIIAAYLFNRLFKQIVSLNRQA